MAAGEKPSAETHVKRPGPAEVLSALLAAIAFAVVLAVEITGGFDVSLAGHTVPVRNLALPYGALVALVFVRWLLASRRVGLGAAFRSIGTAGFAAAAFGLGVFAIAASEKSTALATAAGATLGVTSAAAFVLWWCAQHGKRRAFFRAAAFLVYLGLCVSLAVSLGNAALWRGVFALEEASGPSGESVAADRAARGSDVTFERVDVGGDWRNAAVIRPGGFFYEELDVSAGDVLRFSVSARGRPGGKIVVTAVTGGAKTPVWQSECAAIDAGGWTDVSVPLDKTGLAQIVFELDGPGGPGAALVANQRVETVSSSRPAEGAAPAAAGGTSVIVMIVDCMRSDRLSLYGYKRPTSPEIDKEASGAVVFEQCIAQAPWTKPSMATIFTGLYQTAHGVEAQDNVLQNSIETIAAVFQKAGYRTCAIQGNATLEPQRGFAQGFDEYKMFSLRSPTPDDPHMYPRAEVLNDSALSWLEENASRPFFLYIHYMDTHSPYWPPEEFHTFGEESSDLYDAGLAYFSSEFGKFFARLGGMGVLGSTAVVLTADHGEQFMEHGATEHGNCLHIEELAVPLVIWGPGFAAGRRVPERVRLVDVPVTLRDLDGLGGLEYAEGQSFLPGLRGEAVRSREAVSELLAFKVAGYRFVSITTDTRRFILELNGSTAEIYDPANDPGEYRNIAESEPAVVEELKARAERFVDVQAALGKTLAPHTAKVPLSQEEIDKLAAMGYLNKGAAAK